MIHGLFTSSLLFDNELSLNTYKLYVIFISILCFYSSSSGTSPSMSTSISTEPKLDVSSSKPWKRKETVSHRPLSTNHPSTHVIVESVGAVPLTSCAQHIRHSGVVARTLAVLTGIGNRRGRNSFRENR